MSGITYEDLMKKFPKWKQQAIKRETARLKAECEAMRAEDEAKPRTPANNLQHDGYDSPCLHQEESEDTASPY